MSIEQMAAVLVTFEVLAVLVVILRKHEKQRTILLIIQTAVTVVAFVILFLAPGNDIRVTSEVQNWMPQYEELSLGSIFLLQFNGWFLLLQMKTACCCLESGWRESCILYVKMKEKH